MTSSQDRSSPSEKGEGRTGERSGLVSYLRVFESDSGLLLGHIADISAGGIKLVSHDPPKLNQTYGLKLILPKEIAGRSELFFVGESRWIIPDSNPDFIITGFSFNALSDEQAMLIDAVLETFGRDTTLSPVTSERPACNLTNAAGR